MKWLDKHKVLWKPGILSQEFERINYPYTYHLKYLFNKEFRLRQQRKRKALDDWNEEVNREIYGI